MVHAVILALRGQKQLSLCYLQATLDNQRTLGGAGLVIHHMAHGLRQGLIFLHEGKATYPSPPKALFFLRQKMVTCSTCGLLAPSAASFAHRYTNLQARVIINQALPGRLLARSNPSLSYLRSCPI